jgi:hypothetical protein
MATGTSGTAAFPNPGSCGRLSILSGKSSFIEGIAMPKSKASFGDLIAVVMATPLQAARITYQSFFRPTKLYRDVELGERDALTAALAYWFTILSVLVFLNVGIPRLLGYDMSAVSALGSNQWTRLLDFMSGEIPQQVTQIALFLAICLLWYLMLRIFSRKRRVGAVEFLHSTIYPWASVQIVGYLAFLTFLVFVMTAAIDERGTPVGQPFPCKNLTNYFCRTSYVGEQYPLASAFFNVAVNIPTIWSWVAISIILKDKLGVRKRVTLGALGALVVVFLVAMGALGVGIAILLGPSAFSQ